MLFIGHIQMRMMMTKCLAKSYDFMAINRISIGKIVLELLHYFDFNTNLFAIIW